MKAIVRENGGRTHPRPDDKNRRSVLRNDGVAIVTQKRKRRATMDPPSFESLDRRYPTGTVLKTCSRTSASSLASSRLVGRAMLSNSSMVLT